MLAAVMVVLVAPSSFAGSDSRIGAVGLARAPDAELRRAVQLVDDHRLDAAEQLLEQLRRQYPGDPVPHNELAVLLAGRGELDRSRELLLIALGTDPRFAQVYRNLQAIFGAMASEAYDRALFGGTGDARPKGLLLASLVGGVGGGPAPGSRQTVLAFDTQSADAGSAPGAVAAQRASGPESAPLPAPEALVSGAERAPAAAPDSGADSTVVAVIPSPVAEPTEPARAAAPRDDPAGEAAVLATVEAWAAAWSRQDVDAYLDLYGHHFTPPSGMSRDRWKAQRRERLENPKFIEVSVADVRVALDAPDRATARFRQRYRSDFLDSTVTKQLRLSRNGSEWKIVREIVDP